MYKQLSGMYLHSVAMTAINVMLLSNHLLQLEQLKNEGCLFYSIMHSPKTGNNEVEFAGLPEEVIENVNAVVKVHFPISK